MNTPSSEDTKSSDIKETFPAESGKTLEEHFEDQAVDKGFINEVARSLLRQTLDVCDRHDLSKEGLVREIRHGLKEEYIEKITEADNEDHVELYLEKMAMVGEKRIEINPRSYTGDKRSDMEEYPRKLVEHKLMGCDM